MYYYSKNGQQLGPSPIEVIKNMVASGQLQPSDLVWTEGMSEWKPLSTVPELAGAAPSAVPLSSVGGPPPVVAAQATVLPPAGTQIPNYLVQSILTTLCCCLPLGIPAIVFASQVNSKMATGDFTGAAESSRKAKMWCWIAFGLGILTNLIVFGLQIAAGVAQGMAQQH